MPEDESAPADLSWFYSLDALEDQVSLLRDPHQVLPMPLAKRVMGNPGIFSARWVHGDEPTQWHLTTGAAEKLAEIRARLDQWWPGLSADDRAYIIENRNGEFDVDGYASLIHDAGLGSSVEGSLAGVVSDAKAKRFRLPQMIQVYVEMKATE